MYILSAANIREKYMGTGTTSIKTLLFGIFALILVGELNAKESAGTTLEESNLKKALYCMEILENRPDLESSHRIDILRNECYSKNFIEHAPNIEGGREALLSLFASRYKKYPELSMSIKRTASEGDLVWLHLHVKHTPESLGGAGIHIFRMKDGKIVEHWGVGQPVPKESKNGNTMF
jgi:predicted SnoaL-like aldol condensation-catalyzing enzyme